MARRRRIDDAGRGVLALLVVALLLGAAYLRSSGAIGGDPEVSAVVRNAGGALGPGSDVKLRGVIIGRVTAVERATGSAAEVDPDAQVQVRMTIDPADLDGVPADVVARVLPASVFGTTYVDLVTHGTPSSTALHAGAVIPPDGTQGTLELQQALDDIDRLVKALGPAQLSQAIGAAATALDGRGAELGRTIDQLDSYLAKLEPRLPALRDDVRELADSLEIVRRIAPDVLTATDDALVALRTIAAKEAELVAVITRGTKLAVDTSELLEANGPQLARFFDDVAGILDAVDDNRRAAISDSIATNISLGSLLPPIVREGFAQVDAVLRFSAPPYYTPADRPTYGGGR